MCSKKGLFALTRGVKTAIIGILLSNGTEK